MVNSKKASFSEEVKIKPALRTGKRSTDCVVNLIRTGEMVLERVQAVCHLHNLTLSTANALAIVDGAAEPLSPQKIGERLVVTSGAVTQILDALEKRSLIRRVANPHDRRSVLIEVTPEGQRLRARTEPYLNQKDEVWMAGLSTEEQETLVILLEKVQLHLQQHPDTEESLAKEA